MFGHVSSSIRQTHRLTQIFNKNWSAGRRRQPIQSRSRWWWCPVAFTTIVRWNLADFDYDAIYGIAFGSQKKKTQVLTIINTNKVYYINKLDNRITYGSKKSGVTADVWFLTSKLGSLLGLPTMVLPMMATSASERTQISARSVICWNHKGVLDGWD